MGHAFDALTLLFEDAWDRNDITTATEILERMDAERDRLPSPQAASLFAEGSFTTYLTLGQFARAEVLASTIEHSTPLRQVLMLKVFMALGDRARLHAFIEREHLDVAAPVGWVFLPAFIEDGRLEAARRVAERGHPEQTSWSESAYIEGLISLRSGRAKDAVGSLQRIVDLDPMALNLEPVRGRVVPAQWIRAARLLAEAWLALGNAGEAVKVLERASHVPRELQRPGVTGGLDWLMMRDLLAQTYRRVGRLAAAEAIERELRILLTFADSQHPIKRRLSALKKP
jgi:tetratricopeptide (TPR) repeat protein